MKTLAKRLRKWIAGFLLSGVAFLGIAFLPGSIEGNYRGFISCACDSIDFANFRSGYWTSYGTEHPPAELWGTYRKGDDGGVQVFMFQVIEGEDDKPIMTAYPHFLLTRFEFPDSEKNEWHWKWPLFGETRSAFNEHDITRRFLNSEKSLVTNYYDKDFNLLKQEIKPRKKRDEK